MNTLAKLAINKKISAIFADGTSKMNLGVSTVVGLLSGADRVPVEVAPFSRSSKLLASRPSGFAKPSQSSLVTQAIFTQLERCKRNFTPSAVWSARWK